MSTRILRYQLFMAFILNLIIAHISFATEINNEEVIKDLRALSLAELMDIPITTASKHEESIKDTPVSVIVVTQEQIRTRRYISLSDLLKDLPGVDIQMATHELEYNWVTFRGHADNHKFLILQDGIRVDSPTGEVIAIAENYPLLHAKQVEIVYGPAAALYGADASAGVINIITDKNPDTAQVSTTFGSDNYRYHTFQMGQQFTEDASFNLSGHIHQADTADLSQVYPNEYVMSDLVTLSGQVVKPAAEREKYSAFTKSNSLFGRFDYSNVTLGFNHRFLRHPTTTGEQSTLTEYSNASQWNTEINNGYARYTYQPDEQFSGETLLDYATYEIDPQSKFKNIYGDFQDNYIYARGEKWSLEQQINYQFNDIHRIIAGINYQKFYSLPKTTDLAFPYDPNLSTTQQNLFHIGTDNQLPIEFYEVNYHNYALYAQLQSTWNEQISSVLGIRYDKNSRYGSTINPRLGFVYHYDQDTTLKLFYGEAFRAPSPMDSFETFGIFSGQQDEQGNYISYYFRVPNAELKPEKTRSLELNLSKTLQDNLTIDLSGYYTKVNDLIMAHSQETPTQFIPNGVILSSEINDNIGQSEQYGIDLAVNFAFAINEDLRAQLWNSYSFIEGHLSNSIDASDIALPLTARHKFKLGFSVDYKQKYFVTTQVYTIDRTNNYGTTMSSDIPVAKLETPGYVMADLHLGATQFFKDFSVYLDIYNVFDTHYYNGSFINSLVNFSSVPQQPRHWALSIQYQFK